MTEAETETRIPWRTLIASSLHLVGVTLLIMGGALTVLRWVMMGGAMWTVRSVGAAALPLVVLIPTTGLGAAFLIAGWLASRRSR